MAGVDVGTGATVAFGTTGGTYKMREVPGLVQNLPMVDTTYLGTTTQRTMMAGDLITSGPITIPVLFECNVGLPALSGTSETITITYPKKSGVTTAAKIAGSGTISGRTYGNARVDEVMEGSITFQFDNSSTAATFTAES